MHQPCGVIGCSAHACWQLAPVFLNLTDVEEYLCEKHLAELRKRRSTMGTCYQALCEQAAAQQLSNTTTEESSSRLLSGKLSLLTTGLLAPALS